MPSAAASFCTPEPIASSAETGAASTSPTVIFPLLAVVPPAAVLVLPPPAALAAPAAPPLTLPLPLLQAAMRVAAITAAATPPSALGLLTLTLLICAHALPVPCGTHEF